MPRFTRNRNLISRDSGLPKILVLKSVGRQEILFSLQVHLRAVLLQSTVDQI